MTVSAQTPRSGPYSGNGSTTAFDYGFFVKTDDEIVVTVADAAGAETVKTLTTDYTVSGAGNATGIGGTVTFVTAPVSTERVVVMRTIAMTQAVDLQNRKATVPAVLETAYDKLTRITQDHKEQLSRSVKVDIFGATDVATLTANINIVAGISVSVVAVAGIVDDISLNAANIVAIQGAAAAAVAAGDSATGAATTLASFQQIYLGAKSSAPTLDNAGGTLITGAQYFNDVSNSPFIWTGSAWSPAVFDAAGAALNSENLSGLASKSAARSNLELGTAALAATGDFATAAQGTKADDAAPLDGPTFTGVPAVPTATVGTNTTQAASTAFVAAEIAAESPIKAWVNFDGTGVVSIRDSFNVASITDLGTGSYRINFTNALANANYSVVGIAGNGTSSAGGNDTVINPFSLLTTSVSIISNRGGSGADASIICIQIMGS
jgi:hypothetical protein